MQSMNQLALYITTLAVLSIASLSADQVEISGDASTAPIYVLDGSGSTQLLINAGNSGDPEEDFPGISVVQNFTFTMDNLSSGKVGTQGSMVITGDDGGGEWNAGFVADTDYIIKQFGELISVSFNHKLNSAPGSQTVLGEAYSSASITSKGQMVLVPGEAALSGTMSGSILAGGEKINAFSSIPFTQNFTDIESAELGDWTALVSYAINGRKVVPSGPASTLAVGPSDDPVDTVPLEIKGSFNPKNGLLSLATKGSEAQDKKVTLRVVAREEGSEDELALVDGKSQISAAAQKRKF